MVMPLTSAVSMPGTLATTPHPAKIGRPIRRTAQGELRTLPHGLDVPRDILQEKEADSFAAESLAPGVRPELPPKLDLKALEQLGKKWGGSVDSLVYRCREVGTVSEPAYRRRY